MRCRSASRSSWAVSTVNGRIRAASVIAFMLVSLPRVLSDAIGFELDGFGPGVLQVRAGQRVLPRMTVQVRRRGRNPGLVQGIPEGESHRAPLGRGHVRDPISL